MLKKHRDNLLKLADYLEALPADYKEFDMREYNTVQREAPFGLRNLDPKSRQYGCGTAACALGHGPAAGIRVYGDWYWDDYCKRVFGINRNFSRGTEEFGYLFGAAWALYDNTPHGAAARIRTYVESGVPADWEDERALNGNDQ